ncbi:3-dehydroquinate synthase [Desulfuribacillus stibiiarsenatis]|uniref:3-dehydroquinate synthase n=1 Tax=Desulfuribacillus stibiiarsenatis TaxID=1390249 RepID=A0A1E5L7H9_9FIRM|nr:3-dehydroquinate synthase [Desulfuribacillus stibiiarsenatis]
MQLETNTASYHISFGSGLLQSIGQCITDLFDFLPTKVIVLSDDKVAPLYGQTVCTSVQTVVPDTKIFVVQHGEQSKSLTVYDQVVGYMLENNFDRKSLVIALGGGVVGDLAGFVAATYMRGIPFIQVPTTILAHDSSVGGKVAINHPLGKNTIGAFYQPKAVIYDVDTLKTLPKEQLDSGIAEVVKHGHIHSPELIDWLMENYYKIDQLNQATLADMLYRSCLVKANIVSQDEREQGIRAYLNFGHTIGHSIESALGYGNIPHGIAVAIGMVTAAIIGYQKGITPKHVLDQVISVNKFLGLPMRLPKEVTYDKILQYIQYDKKNVGGFLTFVLLKDIGAPEIFKGITKEEVLDALYYQLNIALDVTKG